MDIQDLKQGWQEGNRYLLVVVDRASKFLFAYPLPSKDAVAVRCKLLELLLTFSSCSHTLCRRRMPSRCAASC